MANRVRQLPHLIPLVTPQVIVEHLVASPLRPIGIVPTPDGQHGALI